MNKNNSKRFLCKTSNVDFKASFDSGYGGNSASNSLIASSREQSFLSPLPSKTAAVAVAAPTLATTTKSDVCSILDSPFKKLQISNEVKKTTIIKLKRSSTMAISFVDTPIRLPIKKQKSCLNENDFFMNILSKNHKLPSNPKFMIGHCIGIERFDLISELNKRAMKPILSKILSNLTAVDYVNMCDVSQAWTSVIENDKAANSKRMKSKENVNTREIANRLKRDRPFSKLDPNSLDLEDRHRLKRQCAIERNLSDMVFDDGMEIESHDTVNEIQIDNLSFGHESSYRKKSTPINNKICSKINKKNLKRL